ncbi:hypothetical protein LXL04_014110 [Taraxacum kok-saghyz]
MISLDKLVLDGLLLKEELPEPLDTHRVNYDTVAHIKDPLIAKAAKRLISSKGDLKNQLEHFCKDPDVASWLEDVAYFAAIDDIYNSSYNWYDWHEPLKTRHLSALEDIYHSKKDFIDIFIAQQFLFQRQWKNIRHYANKKGISVMGDMPIYVSYHSADIWANKKYFLLNRKGLKAFSETGQLWTGGTWKFFDAIFRVVGKINIIAEDLGVITEDVVRLRKSIGAPGMAVLQFGKWYRNIVRSAYYVAPEVLRKYGNEIGIWSVGVMLYILLSGVPPFWAGIFDEILKSEIDFESEPWPLISTSPKHLVQRMLTLDPKKRITSAQVHEHPWIREDGEASDKPIDSAVLSRMKQFWID